MKKDKFINELIEQLQSLKDGEVEFGQFQDKSAKWVNYKKGNNTLEFSFDCKTNKITGIKLWKDIIQVVDHKQLF